MNPMCAFRSRVQEDRGQRGSSLIMAMAIMVIGTIVVDPTFESVAVLGMIVVIRIVLSFALEVEVEGTWPWSRWHLDTQRGCQVDGDPL